MLELQLFKKKYQRVSAAITGSSGAIGRLNPFNQPHRPSVFNESISDPKMEIRANSDLFENVIKATVKGLAADDKSKYKNLT